MASYTQTFSYNGHSFVITVTMRTGTRAMGGGIFIPNNTVDITHFGGSVTSYTDVIDDEVDYLTTRLENEEKGDIDDAPNVIVRQQLLVKGYT